MNPTQKLYEDLLDKMRNTFSQARTLNHDARAEWFREVYKMAQHKITQIDDTVYDSDGFWLNV